MRAFENFENVYPVKLLDPFPPRKLLPSPRWCQCSAPLRLHKSLQTEMTAVGGVAHLYLYAFYLYVLHLYILHLYILYLYILYLYVLSFTFYTELAKYIYRLSSGQGSFAKV